jgi:PAT family beta-lactamase induction signal transducer AmpG
MLISGGILILSDYIAWQGAFVCAGAAFVVCAAASLAAPREPSRPRPATATLRAELAGLAARPAHLLLVIGFALASLWLVDRATRWSQSVALWQGADRAVQLFWPIAIGVALLVFAVVTAATRGRRATAPADAGSGPMFGALLELAQRPGIVPVLAFILTFKLGDAAMGFMVKPFWVDTGFTATEIGLVSVNIGLVLSIAGGLAGGWYADRAGIFRALWVLGLAQAVSNLGYALAAGMIPAAATGHVLAGDERALMYAASALESFTGGLGTAAFLAFLMAIVDPRRAATEYALLSSVFALSRSVAGWASGFGAQEMGYAPYFLLTFFLAFPAYCFLPWVRAALARVQGPHAASP